jgi:hypothetical protein
MQAQFRTGSCELCNDLNSNTDDSTDDRFQLIDGLHRIGHAEPFSAPDNSTVTSMAKVVIVTLLIGPNLAVRDLNLSSL